MATIESLATETLSQIVSYLDSSVDLASFSVQNSRFFWIVEPLLKRRLERLDIRGRTNIRETQEFILAVLINPRLSGYVRHVSSGFQMDDIKLDCDCHNTNPNAPDIGHPHIPSKEMIWHRQLFQIAVEAQSSIWNYYQRRKLQERLYHIDYSFYTNEDRSEHHYHRHFHDAAIAILMPLLPQLHTLELGTFHHPMPPRPLDILERRAHWTTMDEPLSFGFFDAVIRKSCSLLSLKELVLSPQHEAHTGPLSIPLRSEDLTPYDLSRLGFLAEIPSLQKVSAHGISYPDIQNELRYSKFFDPSSEHFSNITELDLRCCYINNVLLSAICKLPKSLEVLRLSSESGKYLTFEPDPWFSPALMGKVLQNHTQSLRVLELDLDVHKFCSIQADAESGFNEFSYGNPFSIGSFADFKVLTTLAIGFLTWLDFFSVDCIEEDEIPIPHSDNMIRISPMYYTHPFRIVDALPESLEALIIYDYDINASMPPGVSYENCWRVHMNSQMAEFMEKKSEGFPNLKAVRGIEDVVHGERVPSPLDELCEEVGISLS